MWYCEMQAEVLSMIEQADKVVKIQVQPTDATKLSR